jgi:hypothetical protein
MDLKVSLASRSAREPHEARRDLTSALETRAPQGGPERPRDGRWRAGDVAQVLGGGVSRLQVVR